METTNVNVLLVDDKPENLLALEKILEEEQVTIFKAGSGLEALELLLVHSFAVAMLDVQMPDMNGFELAELMRAKEATKHIPIIFVTAGAIDSRSTFKGYEVGAVDFLYKPLDVRIVKSKVKIFRELEVQRLIIKNQMDRLTDAVRLRDDFLSIASHELKTPITSIRLQMQLAHRQLQKNEEATLSPERLEKVFSTTNNQLNKLTRLIDDLLDTTRIRAGKLSVEPEEISLSELVNDVLGRYQRDFSEADCDLTTEIEPSVQILADTLRVEQVLVNLLSNVVKYAPGSPVHVSLKKTSGFAQLRVADHGQGIPESKIASIFERFERAQDHKGVSGLGLGLYIVKQIMEAHHGSIRVETSEGKGSTFIVDFPLNLRS